MPTKSQLIKAAGKSAQIIKKTALNQVENLENLNLSVKRLKLGVHSHFSSSWLSLSGPHRPRIWPLLNHREAGFGKVAKSM